MGGRELRKVDEEVGQICRREGGQRECPATMAASRGAYASQESHGCGSRHIEELLDGVKGVAWSSGVDEGDSWLMRDCWQRRVRGQRCEGRSLKRGAKCGGTLLL